MSHIQRSALVPFSAVQMFDLVNDVESYPSHFDWCEGARIVDRGDDWLAAALDLRLGALRASFTTRNTLDSPTSIAMELVEGPFRDLSGGWRFLALGEDGCKVTLTLDFEMAGRFVGSALAIGFQGLADRMVDDFVREARLAYG
jgi:ribosome-associated toxin RatA of RatAB toxin-antitoxin module